MGTTRMGKKRRKSAKRKPSGVAKFPPLGLPAIVAIIHDGAKSEEQEVQLALHRKRVQQLCTQCTGIMNSNRSHGYLREAMRDRGVLEEDLWIMLQDSRRDPELKRKLAVLAEHFKARAELRTLNARHSTSARSNQTAERGRTQESITRKRDRKTKSVWFVQTGRGPKAARRTSSR
jgi:hypothetical protein